MTTSLTLGALRLAGTPLGNGETMTTVSAKDGASTMFLTPAEWQSLLAVSAVVAAAKEWRRTDRNPFTPEGCSEHRQSNEALRRSVDALSAKDHP